MSGIFSWKCPGNVLEMSWKRPGNDPGNEVGDDFQDISRTFPGLFQDISRNFSRTLPRAPTPEQEIFLDEILDKSRTNPA
jgi:hypothetical protein